ncbi:MAG TPA: hypothetical protein VK610_02535 [Rhodothermales bacterium]|nr:hypothetical protein [Rhodothermales bacterium]
MSARPDPTFFVDNDLDAPSFVDVLAAAGLNIERHRDHFDANAPDEEWLPVVAARGWFAFSHNKEIARSPAQTEIVMKTGLGLILVRGTGTHAQMAATVVSVIPKLLRFVRDQERPFIASITGPSDPNARGKKARGSVNLLRSAGSLN